MIGIPQSEDLRAASWAISGVDDLEFTLNLMGQVFAALWPENSDRDERERGTLAAMFDTKPRDALEGMLVGQAIASHNAAMECYRRAMISEQTFEGRHENLNQANKLCRTFAFESLALAGFWWCMGLIPNSYVTPSPGSWSWSVSWAAGINQAKLPRGNFWVAA
jgi:hypothetical protein